MTADHDLDPKILDRVRALLAKAESTSFAEEAAAFTAKAQQLMAAHAIDRALLDSRRGDGVVTSIRLVLAAPYARNKARLLSSVAGPNRCRVIIGIGLDDVGAEGLDLLRSAGENDEIATVFGHRSDLDIVELLFTSLLLQAVNVMVAHGSVVDEFGRNATRSFRHSFLIGFASVVGARLQDTQDSEAVKADEAAGGGVLPVLADRSAEVDKAVDDAFPKVETLRTTFSNGGGFTAGQRAGLRADVGTTRVGGGGPAITGG